MREPPGGLDLELQAGDDPALLAQGENRVRVELAGAGMQPMPAYRLLWAKTSKDNTRTHSLIHHLMDVAQVTRALWDRSFPEGTRRFFAETLAMDIISEVGPGGEYLTSDHTLKHMQQISAEGLFNRMSREKWIDQLDGRSITASAYEKARFLLEHHQPTPVGAFARQEMQGIIDEYETELGVGPS